MADGAIVGAGPVGMTAVALIAACEVDREPPAACARVRESGAALSR
jgi:hypothetical protein